MSTPLAKTAGTAVLWKGLQVAGVKLVFMVRMLVVARLLGPEAYGLLAVALVPIGFLMTASDVGMIPALVQRDDAEERHYRAAWTIGVVRGVGIALIVALSAPLIAAIAAEPLATRVIQALALRPLLQSLASIRLARLTRELDFRSLSMVQLSEAIANTLLAISLAVPLGVWALVVGEIGGAVAFVVASYVAAPGAPRLLFDRAASRSLIRFGRWILATGLLAVVGTSVLRLVVSRQLGVDDLGIYFLAARVAFLPLELGGEVVGAVAFPVYARLQSDLAQAARAFRSMLTGMYALLLPATALLFALTPDLVEYVLGGEWLAAAPVIRMLLIVTALGLVGEMAVPILRGIGRPQDVALLEAVQTGLLVVLVSVLVARFGLPGAALSWVVAVGASLIVCVALLRRIFAHQLSGLGPPMLAIAAVAAAGALAASLVDRLVPGLPGLLAAAGVGCAVALSALWLVERRLGLGLLATILQLFPQLSAVLPFPDAETRSGDLR